VAGKRRADGPAVKKPAPKAKAPLAGRPRLKWFLKWGSISGLVLVLLAVTAFVILYKAIDIPNPNSDFQTETTFVYYNDGKTELGRFATQNRNSIPFEEMPENLRNAVIAAEDRSFETNRGIDPKGILRAAFSNAKGNSKQGASTITQQYVKILYLTQERSYKRKIKEAVVSLKVHNQQSKDQILEGYLNTIYFGRGAYGVDAAAQAYFNKPAKALNLRESAVLASVINNPTQFDPANGPANKAALLGRYQYVLDGMRQLGKIDQAQAERAARRLPKLPKIRGESSYAGQRGHMLEMVKKELLRTGEFTEDEINGGGLRVYTTFSKKAMKAAEEGVKEIQPKGLKGLHTAVASVEPGTGALRGFYAGQDYLDSQINWAVSGGQPGSAFKPFALAAGIEAGFSLKDTFQGNSPFYFNGDESSRPVRNEGRGPDGLGEDVGAHINLITATEKSVNTAYADLTESIPDGPEKILKMAMRLGIPKDDPKVSGMDRLRDSPGLEANSNIALGTASISAINMANAYATIANGGERANVYMIEKVVDRTGEVRYRHKVHTKPALDEDMASDVSYALQQVVQHGTGTNALALGRPAAGKTGTATNGLDQVSSSWFVGYTPQMSTAVMNVRGDGDDQLDGWLPDYASAGDGYFGANYPTRTWVAVMGRILDGEDVESFPPPANVDGDAPTEGHAPFTPKPKPTKTTTAPTTSLPPTTTLPTLPPTTNSPGPDCIIFPNNPHCTETPTPTPTDSASTVLLPGGGPTKSPRLEAYREEYALP
jgi:membrane peptidoglycan carboxypeptidase